MIAQHLQTTITHLAIDLKIFEQLVEADGPLTDTQIAAAASNASVETIGEFLQGRFRRYH